ILWDDTSAFLGRETFHYWGDYGYASCAFASELNDIFTTVNYLYYYNIESSLSENRLVATKYFQTTSFAQHWKNLWSGRETLLSWAEKSKTSLKYKACTERFSKALSRSSVLVVNTPDTDWASFFERLGLKIKLERYATQSGVPILYGSSF